jgi:hypothetical protein
MILQTSSLQPNHYTNCSIPDPKIFGPDNTRGHTQARAHSHTHTQTEHTCTKEAFVNNEKHSNDNYCYDQLVGCFIFLFIINTATINDRVKSVQQIYEIKSIQVDHGITSEGW